MKIENCMRKIVNRYNWNLSKRQTLDNLSALYIGEKKEVIGKKYLAEKLAMLCVVFLIGIILIILTIFSEDKKVLQGDAIARPKKGEITREYKLNVEVNHEEFPVIFSMEEVRLRSEELELVFEQTSELLTTVVLKENMDLSTIRTNLNLVDKIPQYNINVRWESNKPSIVDYQGNVNNTQVGKEGEIVTLTAKLDYYSKKAETAFEVIVMPPVYTDAEIIINSIIEEIKLMDHNSMFEDIVDLPLVVGDKKIKWSEKKKSAEGSIFLVTILIMVVMYKLKDYELEQKVKKRKQQMGIDYSEVVTKLSLLISAGLTTGAAVKKIAADYGSLQNSKKRYAYEELVMCCAGLSNGKTEQEVLEYYGQRCGMPEYLRLTSILSQNLKKGTDELANTLDELTLNAFEHKKAVAKILGEKASTKLLFPMMLLLIIVLVIVVVPTIMSIKF